MRGMGRMKDNGYPIEWGPGRHGPGNNVFAYFCGPDEVPIEYTSEVLQVDDGYVTRGSDYWKFPPGRSDQWGITQPRSARYYAGAAAVRLHRRRLAFAIPPKPAQLGFRRSIRATTNTTTTKYRGRIPRTNGCGDR